MRQTTVNDRISDFDDRNKLLHVVIGLLSLAETFDGSCQFPPTPTQAEEVGPNPPTTGAAEDLNAANMFSDLLR